MKTISIILVTHNSETDIQPCLDAIFAQEFNDYEVIVIDNASQDQTTLILENKYRNIALIKNQENLGFSKAVNQGIARSNAKFILCLNDDLKLKQGFLRNALGAMEGNPLLGAIQPKVLGPDDNRIDTKGIFLSSLRRFYDIGRGTISTDRQEDNKPCYVFGACAAAVLYRKEALETIRQGNEYFDEDFFCLAEDVDIGWRLKKRGWLTQYCPDAVCRHVGGISRDDSKVTQYYSMRNRYLMILKNESLPGLFKLPIVFLIYDLWRNLYMLIINTRYFLKASHEIIKLSPKMLKKRGDRIDVN